MIFLRHLSCKFIAFYQPFSLFPLSVPVRFDKRGRRVYIDLMRSLPPISSARGGCLHFGLALKKNRLALTRIWIRWCITKHPVRGWKSRFSPKSECLSYLTFNAVLPVRTQSSDSEVYEGFSCTFSQTLFTRYRLSH
ncbi:hypothetical protein CPB83DRAFT_853988 [Crepidotus variabilis]|uniref:Uncharacterized protein n=1 Tax=Crepidotus variabilis TaxID=179855 RepID=A0A9P6EFK0_9AGAR|nr:hypothetical protein CPB83DRAFT_853988 [Crepidotus variabilis]